MTWSESLFQSGIKMTLQRKLIASRIEKEAQPFSAEELHTKGLKQKQIDLVTVYRTLALLHEKGFLQKSEFGERKSRYWKSTTQRHQHTLFCKDCGTIETLSDCKLSDQHQQLVSLGFTDLVHRVEFIGRCPKCSVKELKG